jgi:stage II sporulation protein D
MTELEDRVDRAISEEELAAAVAAVFTVLVAPVQDRNRSTDRPLWWQAGRLEGTSSSLTIRSPQLLNASERSYGGRLWVLAARVLLGFASASLLCICYSEPAKAWWIFGHHRHDHEDEANTSQAQQTDVAPPSSSAPPSQSRPNRFLPLDYAQQRSGSATRRLLPINTVQEPPGIGSVPAAGNLYGGAALGLPAILGGSANCIVSPSKFKTTAIRVALARGTNVVEVTAPNGATVEEYRTGVKLASLAPQSKWTLKLVGQNLVFALKSWRDLAYSGDYRSRNSANQPTSSIRPVLYESPPAVSYHRRLAERTNFRIPLRTDNGLVLVPNADSEERGIFALNDKLYRGNLVILADSVIAQGGSAALSFINLVGLEDYIRGVVPAEMPSAWPLEALKAQAIAARTYAYANIGKHDKEGFDVRDTTDDQVYGGVKSEASSSNLAVLETSGIIMTYEGNPICAYFHSASGGITESADSNWGKPLPYLQAVMDYDQQSPLSSWIRTFSVDQLETALGTGLGRLLALDVVSRTPSNRVQHLLVVGSQGTEIVNAETVRRALKLPSTNFNVNPAEGTYCFSGHGFGHGLGLSQWGAKGLAERGYNAAQILTYYYRNVSLERLADGSIH